MMIQQQGAGGGDTYSDDREQLRGVMNKPVAQRRIICRYGRGMYKKKLSYKKNLLTITITTRLYSHE